MMKSVLTLRDRESERVHDAMKRTGATYRQIDYWLTHGHVQLSGCESNPGSGSPRLFDTIDLLQLAAMTMLLDAGVTATAAAKFAETLRILKMRLDDVAFLVGVNLDGEFFVGAQFINDVEVFNDRPRIMLPIDSLFKRLEGDQ